MSDTPPDNTPPADEADISAPDEGAHRDRLAKVMARAGLASRRDAETWIADGRVAVNGSKVTELGTTVGPDDRITVDGKPLPRRERTRLWLYHKPRGLVTTARDPQGRPTVFEVLPSTLPRVISVGRLDLNTEGLLLLTNDGGLARTLSHPDTAWLRRYRVRAFGNVTADRLQALSEGVEIDGFQYGGIEARIDRVQGDNMWLTLGLREGKNREVRRVLEHLGLRVNRLIRLSFGPFQLGDIPEGAVEEVRTRHLRDQLGNLADEAGCDFSAPVIMREETPAGRKPQTDEEGRRKRAGLVTDRRGRRVLVERYENDAPPEKKPAPRARGDERKAGPRTAGPRTGEAPGRVRKPGFVDRPDSGERSGGRNDDRRGPRPGFGKPERFQGAGGRDGRPPRREGDERPFRRSRDDEGQGFGRTRGFDAPRGSEGRPPHRDERPRDAREGEARPPRPSQSRARSQHVFRTSSTPRPERSFGPRGEDDRRQEDRPRNERPHREHRDERPRNERPRGDRPQGDRPYRERPQGDRPYREHPQGERPRGERPGGERRPGGDRPQGGRPYGDRPQGKRPYGDHPQGDRPQGKRPYGDRPQGDRPFRDKGPRSERPQGDRPHGGRPQGDRPSGNRPGGRPGGSRPGGRPGGKGPGGGRPGGNRPGGGGRPGGGKPPGGRRPPPRG